MIKNWNSETEFNKFGAVTVSLRCGTTSHFQWCEASGHARVRTRVLLTVLSYSCVDGFASFPLSPSSPYPLISCQFFISVPFLLSPSTLSPLCAILSLLSHLSVHSPPSFSPLFWPDFRSFTSPFILLSPLPSLPLSSLSIPLSLFFFGSFSCSSFFCAPTRCYIQLRESVKCRCYTLEGNVASTHFSQKEKTVWFKARSKGPEERTSPLFLPPPCP